MSKGYSILAIDTAMAGCNVGVLRASDDAVFTRSEAMMRGQSEALLPMIQDIMQEAGLFFKDLNAIVTTIGPGAFTGLRIGLSTARSFGLSLNIPVCGVTTLEVLAKQYEGNAPTAVLLETKRQDYYLQVFDANKEALTMPAAVNGNEVVSLLKEHDVEVLLGDAVTRYEEEGFLAKFLLKDVLYKVKLVSPEIMLQMGGVQLRDDNIMLPNPLYLRGADVSVRKKPLRKLEKVL